MGHSYVANRLHVVFSTKDRVNSITPDFRERLWPYLVGIGKHNKVPVFIVGGTANHIHMLISQPPTMDLARTIQLFKGNSSKWAGEIGKKFAWQRGYGAFSVSESAVERVKRYIETQEEHHRKQSFEDEFIALLKKHRIPYDPKYVFD